MDEETKQKLIDAMNKKNEHSVGTCPNCGYCPHCGQQMRPIPTYPSYPYPNPHWTIPGYLPGYPSQPWISPWVTYTVTNIAAAMPQIGYGFYKQNT